MNDAEWVTGTMQRAALIRVYERKALQAVNEYEDAKERFAEAKAAAVGRALRNHGNVTQADAEHTAGQDDRVKNAVGDAAFYNREARMYVALVSMLRSPGGYTPST